MATLPRFGQLVDLLSQVCDPRDVDLQVNHLRSHIGQLAPLMANLGTAGKAFSLLDFAALPLLWRITGMDDRFNTFLLSGFDALRDRLSWLLDHAHSLCVLDDSLRLDWLTAIASRGALIANTEDQLDWSAALGPAGPNARAKEKELPLTASRTKTRSIGSLSRIR
jgi:hypothetical protein